MVDPPQLPNLSASKAARSPEELFPLVDFCRAGKLKEVAEWIAQGKPLDLPSCQLQERPKTQQLTPNVTFVARVLTTVGRVLAVPLERGARATHISLASRFEVLRRWDTLATVGTVDPNSDIFSGYIFLATLHLRTPLAVLEHHGERQPGPPAELPEYCEQKDGRWFPIMKSWAELAGPRANRRIVDQLRASEPLKTMASDIGPIPEDGGDYLPFLESFRSIVESQAPAVEQQAALARLSAERQEYSRFFELHRERLRSWFGDAQPGAGRTSRKRTKARAPTIPELRIAATQIADSGKWVYAGSSYTNPEELVLAAYQTRGYTGCWCEGGTLNLLMKAASFPVLVRYNSSRVARMPEGGSSRLSAPFWLNVRLRSSRPSKPRLLSRYHSRPPKF